MNNETIYGEMPATEPARTEYLNKQWAEWLITHADCIKTPRTLCEECLEEEQMISLSEAEMGL